VIAIIVIYYLEVGSGMFEDSYFREIFLGTVFGFFPIKGIVESEK